MNLDATQGGPELRELRRQLDNLETAGVRTREKMRDIADRLRDVTVTAGGRGPTADLYVSALNMLGLDNLTHPDITTVTKVLGMPTIPDADSFWRQIVTRRRKKQLGEMPEKRIGIDKTSDMAFAQRARVPVVTTLFRGSFSDVPRESVPSVLKPVKSHDSIGAFYILEDQLFSISRSEAVRDWDELERIAVQDLGVSDVRDAEWLVQELETLEGAPAPDVKVYSFYGRIGTVLEVSRYPVQRYEYFDGDLNPITFRNQQKRGFADPRESSVLRGQLDDQGLDTVLGLSRELPVPFMRLDFLNTDRGLVFCEFSSAPGWSHDLVPSQDDRLGKMYLEAEIRLTQDLIAGKSFDIYRSFADSYVAPAGAGANNRPTGAASRHQDQSINDYKHHLRRGRQLMAVGRTEEAEKSLRRSLEHRYTPWASAALARLFNNENRIHELHILEDEASTALGDKWVRPPNLPPRRLMDTEKVVLGEPLIEPLSEDSRQNTLWMRNKLAPGDRLEVRNCDGYRITFHRGDRQAQTLLVTFGAANSRHTAGGFGTSFARGKGYDHIYVAQKPFTNYQELTLNEFHQAVAPFAALYQRVVAYGSSLGAYASLYYGGSIDARILASAPRHPGHPLINEVRYRGQLYRHAALAEVPQSAYAPVVLVDPTLAVDVRFIDELVRPLYEIIQLVEVPYAGHAVLRALAETGILKEFISSVVDDDRIIDIAWGGPQSAIWQREKGRRLMALDQWQPAIEHLRTSLEISFAKPAASSLALAYLKAERKPELDKFIMTVKNHFGEADFMPAAVKKATFT